MLSSLATCWVSLKDSWTKFIGGFSEILSKAFLIVWRLIILNEINITIKYPYLPIRISALMMDLMHPAYPSTALSHGEYGVILSIDILFFFKNCFTIPALWIDALSQHITNLFSIWFHRLCSLLITFRYSINISALEGSLNSKSRIVF